MQEKIDGTFGEILPLGEIFKRFKDENFIKETRSIHFGTIDELESVKVKSNDEWITKKLDELSNRIDELSNRIDAIENKGNPSVIWKPTKSQIKKILARCKKI